MVLNLDDFYHIIKKINLIPPLCDMMIHHSVHIYLLINVESLITSM